MRQDDGGEQQLERHRAARTEQQEAVYDVKRDPADGEEKENQEEGRGRLHLPAHGGCRPALAIRSAPLLRPDQPHLLLDRDEDLRVDEEHDDQGRQHAGEEIEVDHVGHVHHQDEEAVAGILRRLVPAHQRHQADEEGQQPGGEDHQGGVARCHQDAIAEGHEDGDVALHSHRQEAEDGALREHDQNAEHEEAQVEVVARQAGARQDGAGNGDRAHADVCDGQRHQEVVGDRAQFSVETHGGADQQVAQSR